MLKRSAYSSVVSLRRTSAPGLLRAEVQSTGAPVNPCRPPTSAMLNRVPYTITCFPPPLFSAPSSVCIPHADQAKSMSPPCRVCPSGGGQFHSIITQRMLRRWRGLGMRLGILGQTFEVGRFVAPYHFGRAAALCHPKHQTTDRGS